MSAVLDMRDEQHDNLIDAILVAQQQLRETAGSRWKSARLSSNPDEQPGHDAVLVRLTPEQHKQSYAELQALAAKLGDGQPS